MSATPLEIEKIDQIVKLRTERYKSQLLLKNMMLNKFSASLNRVNRENTLLRFGLALTTTYSVIVSVWWLS